MRLSMRLDAYLREYMGKSVGRNALSKADWDTVWRVADVARTQNMLTPELVDTVRKALEKLETAREMPRLSLSSNSSESRLGT
jgi:hypothetical protein